MRQLSTTILSLAIGFIILPGLQAREHLKAGDSLPKFSFSDSTGATVQSQSFAGNPLILAYLRPQQKYSYEAMVEIDRALKRFEKQGVRCLAICSETETSKAFIASLRKTVKSSSITYTVDAKGAILAKLGIMVSPTTLVFDKTLKLRHRLPQISPAFARNLNAHLGLTLGQLTQEAHDEILETNGAKERWMFNHHGSRVALARELIMVTEEKQALTYLDPLIKNPHDDLVLLQAYTCIALLNLGRTNEAKPLYEPVLKGKKPSLGVKMARARIAFERGELDQAGTILGTIDTKDSEVKRVVIGLGRLPLSQRKRKNASAYMKLLATAGGDGSRE